MRKSRRNKHNKKIVSNTLKKIMKKNYFETLLQRSPHGADPSINIRDLINPELESNTEEGDEYLDDKTSMKEEPYESEKNEND